MDSEREDWRAVPGWPEHEVSSLGRVRRAPTAPLLPGHVLRLYGHTAGYLSVHTSVLVHRMVATAFHGPGQPGQVVNHKDGDKENNRPENLEWVSRAENNLHAIETGLAVRGEGHYTARLTEAQVREIRGRYTGAWGEQTRLAKEYGVTQGLIGFVLRGQIWKHVDPDYKPQGFRRKDGRGHAGFTGQRKLRTKLSPSQVREIRKRLALGGVSQTQLAIEFGVSNTIVSRIARGRIWKGVT